MMRHTIAIFGEAERGALSSLLFMRSIADLNEFLGNPPEDSLGIFFAIQFLLYNYEVIYIRVKEEGFSTKDYLKGMKLLQDKTKISALTALCLPGVGDGRIIDSTLPVCEIHRSFIISTEKDLYDYLTSQYQIY